MICQRVWKTVKCQGKSGKSQGILRWMISGNPDATGLPIWNCKPVACGGSIMRRLRADLVEITRFLDGHVVKSDDSVNDLILFCRSLWPIFHGPVIFALYL